MKMETRIALSNVKYHKSKNILTGIAIFLTTVLLFLVPTMGMDLINGQKAAVNKLYPTWHALFRNVPEDTVKKISSHHLVEQYGLRSDLGYMASDETKIAMMYMDEKAIEMYQMELSDSENNLNMYYRIFASRKYDADVEAKLGTIVEENGRISRLLMGKKSWHVQYQKLSLSTGSNSYYECPACNCPGHYGICNRKISEKGFSD